MVSPGVTACYGFVITISIIIYPFSPAYRTEEKKVILRKKNINRGVSRKPGKKEYVFVQKNAD